MLEAKEIGDDQSDDTRVKNNSMSQLCDKFLRLKRRVKDTGYEQYFVNIRPGTQAICATEWQETPSTSSDSKPMKYKTIELQSNNNRRQEKLELNCGSQWVHQNAARKCCFNNKELDQRMHRDPNTQCYRLGNVRQFPSMVVHDKVNAPKLT